MSRSFIPSWNNPLHQPLFKVSSTIISTSSPHITDEEKPTNPKVPLPRKSALMHTAFDTLSNIGVNSSQEASKNLPAGQADIPVSAIHVPWSPHDGSHFMGSNLHPTFHTPLSSIPHHHSGTQQSTTALHTGHYYPIISTPVSESNIPGLPQCYEAVTYPITVVTVDWPIQPEKTVIAFRNSPSMNDWGMKLLKSELSQLEARKSNTSIQAQSSSDISKGTPAHHHTVHKSYFLEHRPVPEGVSDPHVLQPSTDYPQSTLHEDGGNGSCLKRQQPYSEGSNISSTKLPAKRRCYTSNWGKTPTSAINYNDYDTHTLQSNHPHKLFAHADIGTKSDGEILEDHTNGVISEESESEQEVSTNFGHSVATGSRLGQIITTRKDRLSKPSPYSRRRHLINKINLIEWHGELVSIEYLCKEGKAGQKERDRLNKVLHTINENKDHPNLTIQLLNETKLALALKPFIYRDPAFGQSSKQMALKILRHWGMLENPAEQR